MKDKYEKLTELAKKRGFFWPSFEIYGGVSGFYDLGPLGTLLKNNIKELWRKYFILKHQDMVVEIETSVITPKKVFEASGHLEHFTDPIVECLKCGRRFRADQLIEEATGRKVEGLSAEEMTRAIAEGGVKCPICGGELSEVRLFNLLFQTTIGPYKQDMGFFRPEAAQGMFTSFKRVHTIMRERMPLGIAQIGRVARNEISPRQGMVRLREFTIMEVEFFFDPENPTCELLSRCKGKLNILTTELRSKGIEKPEAWSPEEAIKEGVIKTPWLAYWMCVARDFVKELGVPEDEMFFEEKYPHERAHYATQTFDQLVKISRWGWVEVSGHAYRGDYDLSRHMKYSGQDMTVFKKYDKPIIVKRLKVQVDKAFIGRTFGKDAAKVFRAINQLSQDELIRLVKESGEKIPIGGIEIPKEAIKIQEVEEKVSGKRYIPHVVEPSFGAERLVLVVLDHAYTEEADRVVLKIPKRIAPIKAAVFPLVSDDRLVTVAKEIYSNLVSSGLTAVYDDSGSIGRRYARVDEIGVPYAVTVDFQTLEDNTVTIRDRDTKEQFRVKVAEAVAIIKKLVSF
jgi:glycyl-tRNA synthetase